MRSGSRAGCWTDRSDGFVLGGAIDVGRGLLK
jgi:hypothetical protein